MFSIKRHGPTTKGHANVRMGPQSVSRPTFGLDRCLTVAIRGSFAILFVAVAKDWLMSGRSDVDFPYRLETSVLVGMCLPLVPVPRDASKTWHALFLAACALFTKGDPSIALAALGLLSVDEDRAALVSPARCAILLAVGVSVALAGRAPHAWAALAPLAFVLARWTRTSRWRASVEGWTSATLLVFVVAAAARLLLSTPGTLWGAGLTGRPMPDLNALSAQLGFLVPVSLAAFLVSFAARRISESGEEDSVGATGTHMALLLAGFVALGGVPFDVAAPTLAFVLAVAFAYRMPLRPQWRKSSSRLAVATLGLLSIAWLLWAAAVGQRASSLRTWLIANPWKAPGFCSPREVPASLATCTVAMEDRGFYEHHGFDYVGLHRALRKDVRSLSMAQGGSTITQQAARYAFVGKRKSFLRKLDEAVMASALERTLSKMEILALYLSTADYGFGNIGAKNASVFYFDKALSQLDVGESLFLVSAVVQPPHDRRTLGLALVRMDTALGRLRALDPEALTVPVRAPNLKGEGFRARMGSIPARGGTPL